MTGLVAYLLLFVGVGIFFVLFHLLMGMLVRPIRPDPEKKTIYECGEPTIGSSWIQFDLRFYVVALLFVIFDVEVAFFFPWAVLFGQAAMLARPDISEAERTHITSAIAPAYEEKKVRLYQRRAELARAVDGPAAEVEAGKIGKELDVVDREIQDNREAAQQLAWVAFADIVVFFGVLLVGFAYLWKRGDLDWVRSIAAERVPAGRSEARFSPAASDLVAGSGRGS